MLNPPQEDNQIQQQKTMTNVLFVAYQFPPRSGAGVHRSLNFVKYLRQYGYNPIVFTIDEKSIRRETNQIDPKLLDQIPSDIQIERSPSYSIGPAAKWLQKVHLHRFFWVLVPPFCWEWSMPWSFFTYFKAKKLIKKHDIKVVYTSSGPFSPMMLGYLLQKTTPVKWVADLRDPFTDAYMWIFPTKLHWGISRLWERFFFSKPDKLIVNTESVRELYLQRKLIPAHKIVTLTSGF